MARMQKTYVSRSFSQAIIHGVQEYPYAADHLTKAAKMTNLNTMAEQILHKMAQRQCVVDWAPFSYDRRVAMARAYRVFLRARGERISFTQALQE